MNEMAAAAEPEERGEVMGTLRTPPRPAVQQWLCQFEALTVKNFHYAKARASSLLVIVLMPTVGVLLVELLRAQAQKYGEAGGDSGDAAVSAVGGD